MFARNHAATRNSAVLRATTALAVVFALAPFHAEAQAPSTAQPRPPAAAAPQGQAAAANPAAPGTARTDADMSAVLQALQALGARPLETLTPEQARRQPSPANAVMQVMQQRNIQPSAEVRAVRTRDMQVQGAAGMVPARLYTPGAQSQQAGAALPLIVYWHGGGWVIADLDTYDATPRALAAQTGAVVISLHYRQAPEHRFPAAHDDALAAYRWVVDNARELGADPSRIAVAGESAGGNLAMNVAIAARDQNLRAPLHVLAVYPVAGADMTTPSYRENAQAAPLSRAGMEWFVRHVFSDPAQAQDPRINLLAARLNGLPNVTIITAQIDPLRSEGEMLAERLRAANVAVQLRNFDGVTHEFFGMAPVVADATAAQQFAVQQLRAAFGGGVQAAGPGATGAAGGERVPTGPAAAPADRRTPDDAARGASRTTPTLPPPSGTSASGATMGAVVPLTAERARALIGTNLVSADGRNTGEIDNFIVDGSGAIRAAVVEWGGFLGIGERRAVVALDQIQFAGSDERARLILTREQLEALPRYDRNVLANLGRERGWGEGLRLYRN